MHCSDISLCTGIIKQGDSGSEVIIQFGANFKLSVGLIQLSKVITVFGFTFRKLFVV